MLRQLHSLNTQHLFLVLLLIHLLPLWCFRYFPSQDGMCHVYNAYLLKEYHNPALYKTREVFQLNLTLFPNWMSHVIMAGLMFIVPPLTWQTVVDNGVLILVIHSLDKGENAHWVWSGCTIERHQ